MTPDQPREPLPRRIYREMAAELMARPGGPALSWPAVHAAERRLGARVRLTIAGRLEVPDTHPRMAHARMILAQDSPEQTAHDAALVSRWRQVHGIVVDTAGACVRIAAMDRMP
jgi:hypothetical protein